jgi:hypothetical protein
MQSNTTGHSMEVFCIILLKLSLLCNFLLFKQVRKITAVQILSQNHQKETKESIDILLEDFGIFHSKVDTFLNTADLLSREPTNSTTKPIKPNNWDSVREAFKGPVRVDNERT